LGLRGPRFDSYEQFRQTIHVFWLIEDSKDPELDWISNKLRSDGVDMRLLNVTNTRIYRVTLP
jgi:hypothetical protein